MLKKSMIPRLTLAVTIIFVVSLFAVHASAGSKKKTIKQQKIDEKVKQQEAKSKKPLFFKPIPKRFWVDKTVSDETVNAVADIENAEWVLDGRGKFPPKSLVVKLANTNKPMNYIIPMDFGPGHLRRFNNTGDYSVWFKVKESDFDQDSINRLKLFRMKKRVFVADLDDFTEGLRKSIDRVGEHSFILIVGEKPITKGHLTTLKKMKSSTKQIIVDEKYDLKTIKSLARLKRTMVLVQVHGGKLDIEVARNLNEIKKEKFGVYIRGIFKREEAYSFVALNRLDSFTFLPENWNLNADFVDTMNSSGR